ncbi:MAG: 8-amino-7-oxononanoate synthase [Leptospira sp.]|nr:8-amino-7-oxononanoate synthase [Leptospira sp.]
MPQEFYQSIQKELSSRDEKNLRRSLYVPQGIDFCSNDYLGLAKDSRIHNALMEGIGIYGAGSTASRLVRGHSEAFVSLERKFSFLSQGMGALFVANGFTANLGLMDAIADLRTVVFCDRLNHASILDGIRLSGAKRVYYDHLDMNDLRAKLEKHRSAKRKILISETIFSMDGDALPIEEYVKLAEEFDVILVLDETHAVGVFGKMGGGLSCDEKFLDAELIPRIDFRIYTMGKALGLEGGLIVYNNESSKDFLINCMRNFIFSTAPMPAIAHAGITACEILFNNPDLVAKPLLNSDYFRKSIQGLAVEQTNSISQIIPLILNSEEQALSVSKQLQDRGLDVRAIRPPTVPSSRLRISIHADHKKEELDRLSETLFEILD